MSASPSDDLVSCLCITHRRVAMLRRAVHCFLAQTWGPRELLVLHEDVDHDTRDFVAALAHPLIRTHVVPATPHIPLGTKRQIAVEAARGRYVATWDDDDWSAPTRLASEMAVIRDAARPVCVLGQWIVFDQPLGQAWLSQPRTWEASMVAERAVLPAYGAGERGEDLISMRKLVDAGQVATLRRPELYVYVYHGTNVGSRVHFKRNVFAHAKPLPADFSRRVQALLARPQSEPAIALEELQRAAGASA